MRKFWKKTGIVLVMSLVLTMVFAGASILCLQGSRLPFGSAVFAAGAESTGEAAEPARPEAVIDEAGVLSASELAALSERARSVAERYQCDVAIIAVQSIGDADPYKVAVDHYWNDGYGYGEDSSGVLLLFSRNERKFAFFCVGNGERYITPKYGQVKLEGLFLPSFRENLFYEGFAAFIDGCEEIIGYAEEHGGKPLTEKNDPNPMPKEAKDTIFNFIVCVLIPVGIAFLFCSSARSKMKTAKRQRAAQVYIPKGGFELQHSEDVFLHKTETRQKIESSSGGSSSRSGGGGSGRSGSF